MNEVSARFSSLPLAAQVPHMQALLSIALLLVVAARAATTLQGRVDNPDLFWSTAAPICWNKRTHSPPPTESVPIDAHIVALSSRTLDERSYDLLATHSALMLSSRPSHRPLLCERHRRVCAHTAFHHDRMHSHLRPPVVAIPAALIIAYPTHRNESGSYWQKLSVFTNATFASLSKKTSCADLVAKAYWSVDMPPSGYTGYELILPGPSPPFSIPRSVSFSDS